MATRAPPPAGPAVLAGPPEFLLFGRRLPVPEVRIKPCITGPDGGNTRFFIADLTFAVPGSAEPDGS